MGKNDEFNLALTEFLTSKPIKIIEDEIIWVTQSQYSKHNDSPNAKNLLKVRKKLINDFVLNYQKELLPVIVDFNENFTKNIHNFYTQVKNTYNLLMKTNKDNDISVLGKWYLDSTYPENHPLQNNTRQTFWEALTDTINNNILAEINFTFPYHKPTFNEIIYLGNSTDNWNEGLDENLTKDLHLIYPFHDLFEHSNFALTDFIYCRDFIFEIKCDIDIFPRKKR